MADTAVLQTPSTTRTEGSNHRRCTKCIIDSTVPGAKFDSKGVCNFCATHSIMEREYPNGARGEAILQQLIAKIKADGRGKKYDCVQGISGGRDSTYTLWLSVKKWGLRPLAVHFNDGFGNPVAGENMIRATKTLGVDLLTITSDWRESKDIKIACLKASTIDMEIGTDLGIATALFGAASKENLQTILIGQSFRTEGIMPLTWNYLDGYYLHRLHKQFGTLPLRKWKADDPGFNLNIYQLFYYSVIRRIKVMTPLYYHNYIRSEATKIITDELGWVNTGAHYFDDLYQALLEYIFRIKFNVDRRKVNYSALIRSGQMPREEAIERVSQPYALEDPKIIELCVKRLGISRTELESYIAQPPKTFRDFPNHYWMIRSAQPLIFLLSRMNLLPRVTYEKYFHFV